MLSLGLIPNKKAHVTATVAGVLLDVRTGYIYGTTEATSTQEQRATIWSTDVAIETARLKAEKEAFDGFVDDFERLWPGVVNMYRGKALASESDNTPPDGVPRRSFRDADRLTAQLARAPIS